MSDASHEKLIREDEQARVRALNVTESFLVQAPAGSGKTELLIRRMLALLSRVDRPERILAMTFTRKAAAEMRERVIVALRDAHSGVQASSPYEQQTRDLALAVLAQDAKHQWHLIEQPSRLRVMTIDAFCVQILRQTPLSSLWGAMPTFEDNFQTCYEAAVSKALRDNDEEAKPFWCEILKTLGNNGGRLVKTLSLLLAKREQWLPFLVSLSQQEEQEKQDALQKTLLAEIENELVRIHGALKRNLVMERETLRTLMRYAAGYFDAKEATKAQAQTLMRCVEREDIWPLPDVSALGDWNRLADWLLTQDGHWRKKIDINCGFPSKEGGGDPSMKKSMMALLAEQSEDSANTLARARILPSGKYHEDEWRFINALLYLLPRLLARFQVMAAHNGVFDFTEAQLAAMEALGGEDAPSDVLLTLDMRIEHLLIDEFQDTSQTQISLLRKLTSGWQPGDGRTLFAVGDPMQSIYRFRQADVGLFLKAQATRYINEVPVTLLTLTRNFRSQAQLVEWTNTVFPEVFSRDEDVWRGAVSFKASAPTREPENDTVRVCVVHDVFEEGAYVAQQTKEALERGAGEVAILVRARSHLQNILPALRSQGIPFTAVLVDRLGDRQVIADVLMLTRTLIQPDDDLPWLSVLRAPWCGLTLADLTALAHARMMNHAGNNSDAPEKKPCLPSWSEWLLALPEHVDRLSEDGRRRLTHFLQCWQAAYEASHDRLSQRVYSCWLALQGSSCLDGRSDALAVKQFFECLDEEETAGELMDWPLFKRRLEEAFLPEDVIHAEESNAHVKVMTLHQAKGLQFDTVIMPGLGRGPGRSETPLLRWRQRPQGLLLAAQPSRSEKNNESGNHSGLDAYLNLLETEEARHELTRLLYVGVTRAKQQLILTAVSKLKENKNAKSGDTGESNAPQWTPPKKNTAMVLWWDVLCAKGMIASPEMGVLSTTPFPSEEIQTGLPLRRLPTICFDHKEKPVVVKRQRSHATPLTFDEANVAARHAGTVVHDWLSRVGVPEGQSLQDWTPAFLESQRETVVHALAELGVPASQRDASTKRVMTALAAVRDDPFAQWLLDPTRESACNEWSLSATTETPQDDSHHVRLDRSFMHEGIRWIVDYKISETNSADVETWLDTETEKHRPQMEAYATLMKRFEDRPLKLVVYYPLLQRWREIE